MSPDEEKIDALDFVIKVLKEHEKNLDRLAERLENIVGAIEKRPEATKPIMLIRCKRWADFKGKSTGASIITFDVEEKTLRVDSLSDERLYRYVENLPGYREKLECGLEISLARSGVDPTEVKRWLSKELNVPEKNVIEGKITL